MSHHKNSWKDKVGTSFRSFFIFFSGDILEEKCWWRSVRPCLLLRMAGCTSRCRQGVLKLIQSLQRLVSGTLAKGTLSLKCTFYDNFMGSFPLRFILRSTSEPITVGLLTYLKHLHNFFYKESICIPLLMLDACVFFYHVVQGSINFPPKSSLFINSHVSCQCLVLLSWQRCIFFWRKEPLVWKEITAFFFFTAFIYGYIRARRWPTVALHSTSCGVHYASVKSFSPQQQNTNAESSSHNAGGQLVTVALPSTKKRNSAPKSKYRMEAKLYMHFKKSSKK